VPLYVEQDTNRQQSQGEAIAMILNFFKKINRLGVWIGGSLMILTSLLIGVEVVLRKLFSISIGGADELSSYVLAISCSWAFGYALLEKAHIRIDILYARFPQRLKVLLDISSLLIFVCYLLPLCYFAGLVFKTSLFKNSTANTPLQTPLWIPQGIWLLGLVVFLLTMLVMLAASVVRLSKGDLIGSQMISGPTTLEDEIEEGVAMARSPQGEDQVS
jgi:TRAP-type C4-dicarboxylate transport system permease small subunit